VTFAEDGSFLQPAVTSFLLGSDIFLSTQFSKALDLCSSLNVRNQISHPHEKIGNIMVLCITVFKFLGSRQEDKKILNGKLASIPQFCRH
jgi:hypothetical protein